MSAKAFVLLFRHDFQDFRIGFLHAVASHASDVVYGLFHGVSNDAVATHEAVAVLAHLIAEDAGFHSQGNLSGARWLGAVANDACRHAQGIFKSVVDYI